MGLMIFILSVDDADKNGLTPLNFIMNMSSTENDNNDLSLASINDSDHCDHCHLIILSSESH